MLNIYVNHTETNEVIEIFEIQKECWVKLTNPTQSEMERVERELCVPMEFLHASLDSEEKSRIESEDDIKLIIVDIPIIETDMPEYEAYSTLPMAIITTQNAVVTVCLHDTSILKEIIDKRVKHVQINFRARFVFTILIGVASRFISHLYKIEKTSTKIERQLNESLKNEQLLQLLALSKSLTYFSTSLKSSEITVKKIMRGHIFKLYEEDVDLLDDALIEISQAIEMSVSYSAILKATMETYSSVASNNLNDIMKVLAVITIVMTVPEIIFAFYGMNVLDLPLDHFYWFPMLIAWLGCTLTWVIIQKSKFYK